MVVISMENQNGIDVTVPDIPMPEQARCGHA